MNTLNYVSFCNVMNHAGMKEQRFLIECFISINYHHAQGRKSMLESGGDASGCPGYLMINWYA